MRTYGLHVDAAFLIDEEVAAYIILNDDRKNGKVPEAIEETLANNTFVSLARKAELPDGEYANVSLVYEFLDSCPYGDVCCAEFSGEAISLQPQSCAHLILREYQDDFIAYLPAARDADLFEAAYSSIEEIRDEFMSTLKGCGIEFPEDFDWLAHIVSIEGAYFC